MKKQTMLLGGAGVLLVVAIASYFVVQAIQDQNAPPDVKAGKAVNTFLAKLAREDFQGAYNSGAAELRSKQTLEEFTAQCKYYNLHTYESANWSRFTPAEGSATLSGTITFQAGMAIAHKANVVEEDGGWMVVSVTSFNPGLPDPNTVKPPDEATVLAMLKTNLSDLATAIEKDDFRSYMRKLPQALVQGVPAAKIREPYKELIEKKVDVSILKTGTPKIDPAPSIDDTGHLIVKGAYPDAATPLQFEVQYSMILGEWKMTELKLSTMPTK